MFKVERFNEFIIRLYGDNFLLMSEASITQKKSYIDKHTAVTKSRCPLMLWKLVIKSHTFAGIVASFLEKEKAKSKLQALKQGSQSSAEHHARFDQKLQICKDMQIESELKWVIYTSLLILKVITFGQMHKYTEHRFAIVHQGIQVSSGRRRRLIVPAGSWSCMPV